MQRDNTPWFTDADRNSYVSLGDSLVALLSKRNESIQDASHSCCGQILRQGTRVFSIISR